MRPISKRRRKQAAIGAALALAATASVTGAADAADIDVTNTDDSGPGSLREAMIESNGSDRADRILFKAGVTGEIKLESDLPASSSAVTITGPGRDRLSINGNGNHLVFHLLRDTIISGLTVEDGYRAAPYSPPNCGGRGCYNYDYVPAGGAITIENRIDVTVRDSAFKGNRGEFGGAISTDGQTHLTVTDSSFSQNNSDNSGGAISATGGASLEVLRSSFSGNTALDGGGAIKAGGPETKVAGSSFSRNSSRSDGGAVKISGSNTETAILSGSTFEENSSRSDGGGASMSGQFRVSGSTFTGNRARASGGGIAVRPVGYFDAGNGGSSIESSTLSGNASGANNPGYYFTRGGGGIWIGGYGGSANLGLSNLTVTGNTSIDGNGGGISSERSGVTADSLTITGNHARSVAETPRTGGGFHQARGSVSITNSIISGNAEGDVEDLSYSEGYAEPAGGFEIDFSLYGKSDGALVKPSVPGSNLIDADPKLGKLAGNGGPTRTMKPSADSPVINRGSSSKKRDQRGSLRPVRYGNRPGSKFRGGDWSDMGAVELQDNRFSFGGARLNRQEGIALLAVRVRSAGKLILLKSGSVVGSSRLVGGPGAPRVKISPRGAAAVKLNRTGKAQVKVRVRFIPPNGKPMVKGKRLNLRRR